MSAQIAAATADTFDSLVIDASRRGPVLVDFWAAWCGPCRMLAPILERVATSHAGRAAIVKVDTDAEQELAGRYGIRSLPTLKLFKDGKVVEDLIGLQPESAIRAVLDRYVAKPEDATRAEARQLLAAGQAARAVALLEGVVASAPDLADAKAELVEALAMTGRLDDAETMLETLPVAAIDAPRLNAARARLHFARLAATPPTGSDPMAVDFGHAARELLGGRPREAMDRLLDLLSRDRRYDDALARRSLLHAFALVDAEPDLIAAARRRMAVLLN